MKLIKVLFLFFLFSYNYSATVIAQCPFVLKAGKEIPDTAVVYGETVQLHSDILFYTGDETFRYRWTPSIGLNNDTIANPITIIFSNITYTVTVTAPSGCTASCSVVITIFPMAKPEIGIIGVNSSNKNMIVWNKPVLKSIESYSIYKETNVSNVYQKIGTVPYDSLSVFIDNQSFPDIQSSRYEMTILDGYGLESAFSNPHKTIHLSINKGLNTTWNLIWESYEGFTVSTYNIYRGTNANNLSLIGTTSGSSNQYSDISAPVGDVYYQLEVISPNAVNPAKVSTYLQKLKDSGNSHESSAESYNSSRSNIASNVVSDNNELVYDEGSSKINIIPNPVSDKFYVTGIVGTAAITVSDLSGRLLLSKDVTGNEVVTVSALPNGVYLTSITSKSRKTMEKLIIQR